MKILLVEDNQQVGGFLKKGLLETGHVVDWADNGRDGMALAIGEIYDAIVLDRMLPGGIDGLSIVAALRASGNKVPVLILSALDEVDERIRGLKAGGDDYVVKPFSFGEVVARLEALAHAAEGLRSHDFGSARETEFHLFESKLRPSGAEYTKLETFPFAKAAA